MTHTIPAGQGFFLNGLFYAVSKDIRMDVTEVKRHYAHGHIEGVPGLKIKTLNVVLKP